MWKWITLGGFLLCLGAGCARDDQSLGTPRLLGPGTAADQQRRAIRFDPYPENEAGPELTGVRPPSYDKPIPEVDRGRWQVPVDPYAR